MSYFDCFLASNRLNSFFYAEDVNDEKVGSYLKMLKQKKKKLGDLVCELPSIAYKNEIFEEMKRIINDEIRYCNFYFEYNKKKRKCPYFNKWIYYKPEDRPDQAYNWDKERAIKNRENAWVTTNGKILAVITVQDKTTSIKVILKIKNNSGVLQFMDSREKEICYKNFRKKESVDKYTEELKDHVATEIFPKKLLSSKREYNNVEKMLKLLHADIEISEESKDKVW